jgi:hypothetical protein
MKLKLPHTDEVQNDATLNVPDNPTNETAQAAEASEAIKTESENAETNLTPTTALGPVLDDAVESQPVVRKKHVAQDKPVDQSANQPVSASDQLKNAGGFVAAVGAALLGLMGVFVVARGGVMRGSQPNTSPAEQPDLGRGAADGAGSRYL